MYRLRGDGARAPIGMFAVARRPRSRNGTGCGVSKPDTELNAPLTRWLVGGAARCGKSALAAVHVRNDTQLAALRVDALLHRYRHITSFRDERQAREFLRTYLQRPRFMDAGKQHILRPSDDFPATLEEIVDRVRYQSGISALALIGAALDALARMRDKTGWLVLDLHSELHFRHYAATFPNLKMLVCLRDPIEAVTASIYWRSFPDRCERADRKLKHAARLWRVAAAAASSLRAEFPGRVHLVSSNDLMSGKARLPSAVHPPEGAFADLFGGPAYFSSRRTNANVESLCPDGNWRSLLDDAEYKYLAAIKERWWRPEVLCSSAGTFEPPTGLLETVAARYPLASKAVVDTMFRPAGTIRRQVANARTWARHVLTT